MWGGSEGSQPLERLLLQAERSSEPIVLVTTIHSFKKRFLEQFGSFENSSSLSRLHSVLSTVVYDETHHLGASEARALMDVLINSPSSDAFLLEQQLPLFIETLISTQFTMDVVSGRTLMI